MNEAQLRDALEKASAHFDAQPLATRALAERSRRLRHRRAFVVGMVVLAVALPSLFLNRDDRSADRVDTPQPTPTSTSTLEYVGDQRTQPVWDPFDLPAAPRRDSVLPTTLGAPETAPSIADNPLPDIVIAWPEKGRDLRLLGSTGEWRSVPGTASAIVGSLSDVVWPSISPTADRVAMSTDAGILVVNATGNVRTIPWPPELEGPFDTRPALLWAGDDGFVVLHWKEPWVVGFEGNGEPAPFGGKLSVGTLMVDPDDGTVREKRWKTNDLVEWDGDTVQNRVLVPGYGERLATRFGLVAYTGAPAQTMTGQMAGPVVVDAATGDVVGYAPVRDPSSVYSDNGFMTVQGFLDPDTVLLLVGPMNFGSMEIGEEQWHLVAWHFRDGDFELITTGDSGMRGIEVAPDLL